MRITMLKNPARVPDLLADLFGNLPAAERDLRIAEFKAANPQLGRRVNLGAGTVLLVPLEVPAHAAPLADAKDLAQASARTLAEATGVAMDEWVTLLKEALAKEARDVEVTAAALKAREVREVTELHEVVASAVEALKARAEGVEAGKAFVGEIVPRIMKDLQEVQARLA